MKTLIAAALSSLVVATAMPAAAGEAEDAAVKFRQQLMGGIAASATGVAMAVKGDEEMQAVLGKLTAMLAASADYDIIKAAFALNTTGETEAKTTATAKIWDEPEEFDAAIRKLADAAAAVGAMGADVSGAELKELFGTCKGCHDEFREK